MHARVSFVTFLIVGLIVAGAYTHRSGAQEETVAHLSLERRTPGDDTATIISWDEHFSREFTAGNGGQWAVTSPIGGRSGARLSDVVLITKLPHSMGGEDPENPLRVKHYHPVREEFFVPIEGRARAFVNGEEVVLEPGEVVFIPAGVVHELHLSAVALDDQVFKMLEIGAPLGASPEEDAWVTEEDYATAVRLARSAIPPLPGF